MEYYSMTAEDLEIVDILVRISSDYSEFQEENPDDY